MTGYSKVFNMAKNVIGGDLAKIFDANLLIILVTSTDPIGVVLRIHFCIEAFLDLWCKKITNTEDFFDFGFIGFDKKLSIAKKLGFPEDVACAFKRINKIRNKFAHDIDAQIQLNELNELRREIDIIETFNVESFKISEMKIESKNILIKWNEDLSAIKKIVLLYSTLSLKLFLRYRYEFEIKGVEFKYLE